MIHKLIIDTDPGIDDAFTIFLANAHPQIQLLGLTTVFGNVHTHQATNNAIKLLELADAGHIPVAHGAELPLSKIPHNPADFVHGKDGFGNTNQSQAAGAAIDLSAAEFIVQQIMQHPSEVTICAIAPLTNLALALEIEPKIARYVKQIIIMGGAIYCEGNINPVVEANIWGDPLAADKVLTAGWDVTLIGLDVTHKIILDAAYLSNLAQQGGEIGQFLYDISQFYHDFYTQTRNLEGIAAHDPTTIAYLVHPELFTVQEGVARVATEGIAAGQIIFSPNVNSWVNTPWDNLPVIKACIDVQSQKVINFFTKNLLLS